MTNANYSKGRSKEYRIMRKYRALFPNAVIARSAGSHSEIDVWVLDTTSKQLIAIQSKGGKSKEYALRKVDMGKFNGSYQVSGVAL